MSTITTEQQAAIAAKVNGMTLPSGLGDEHAACSIAAINLALTGRLTDAIPDCMSRVVGQWIITVQDAMSFKIRNSPRWKGLLPLAAGTGREHEEERIALILDWMWGTVLPTLQPLADARGFGADWRRMTTERTVEAARAAEAAAEARLVGSVRPAKVAATAAWAKTWATRAEKAQVWAEEAASAAARVAEEAEKAAKTPAWEQFDPCALLERLIAVGEQV